jgi:hypothetical protein
MEEENNVVPTPLSWDKGTTMMMMMIVTLPSQIMDEEK